MGISNAALDASILGTGAVWVTITTNAVGENPVDAADILAADAVAAGATNQFTTPEDADGGNYSPPEPLYTNAGSTRWLNWINFIAQPVGSLPIEGVAEIPGFPSYLLASALRALAVAAWPDGGQSLTTWRRQADVTAGGVDYEVWLLSRDATRGGSLPGGSTRIVYRTGDGFGE